jgi:hypothetical protein
MFSIRKFLFLLTISFLISLFPIKQNSFAQSSTTSVSQSVEGAATLGVAHLIQVKAKNVKDGNILSASLNGASLSNTPYDSQVLGIVSRDAAVIISSTEIKEGIPVISVGTVYVLVSTQQGKIKKGDKITTSTISGVGVKATKDGYILGEAMEDDANPNKKAVDKIAVNLSLNYFNSRPTLGGTLTDIFKFALLPTKEGPGPIFKYMIAAGVLLASLILGFMSFAKTAAKGVEALGRNPAASRIIQLGIIFNVFIVIIIVLAGISIAFLILRL